MTWLGTTHLPSMLPEDLVFGVAEPTFDHELGALAVHFTITARGDVVAEFTERFTIPGEVAASYDATARAHADQLARLLALVAGLSYFKTCVPATISVPGGLTSDERIFLAEVVAGGLSEFAYVNDLPRALEPHIDAPDRSTAPPDPIDTPIDTTATSTPAVRRVLIAVGGGKDSIVSIEALKPMADTTLFSVNDYAPIAATAEVARRPRLVAGRTLDPHLHELNAAGALNGHVPVTAINSLIACLTALRTGHDTVAFSNESSASFGNLVWHGHEVNHQWSKSLTFERLLRHHLRDTGIDYVSLLRAHTELAVMRRFATVGAPYFSAFTSCNRAFHLDPHKRTSWCGDCPKCRFVFLCLAPFTTRDTLVEIFGRDVLADPAQFEGLAELLNLGGRLKPFECVGEPDECRAAVTLLRRHPDFAEHAFLTWDDVATVAVNDDAIAALFTFGDAHCLAPDLEQVARGI